MDRYLQYLCLTAFMMLGVVEVNGISDGERELIYAVKNNDTYKVNELLSDGVSANATSDDKRSALCYAITNKNIEILRALLEYNADPNAEISAVECDFTKMNAERSGIQMVKYDSLKRARRRDLFFGVDFHSIKNLNFHALIAAILLKFDEGANLLIQYGADPNTSYSCIIKLFNDTQPVLTYMGRNIDERRIYGRTALHDAVENGSVSVVEKLLEYGANPLKCEWICPADDSAKLQSEKPSEKWEPIEYGQSTEMGNVLASGVNIIANGLANIKGGLADAKSWLYTSVSVFELAQLKANSLTEGPAFDILNKLNTHKMSRLSSTRLNLWRKGQALKRAGANSIKRLMNTTVAKKLQQTRDSLVDKFSIHVANPVLND
ncbi:MAG: hypothetical protein US49_C0007G0055 [candidate division TM6 bacterium GW2011_GWF2_37_49]|nr:MAG: hypothetical protein US49_C0007G0055 [candidate division TM6 bacterium GW2011_GWF2_37_49]